MSQDRLFEMARDAGLPVSWWQKAFEEGELREWRELKKFTELIVRECADTIVNRAPGQMGKEGEGWTNGYDDGLKTGAFLIKEQFGVKE